MYIQWFMLVLLVGSCCGHFFGGHIWPEGMVLQRIPNLQDTWRIVPVSTVSG